MGLRVCLVTPFSWSQPHSVNEHVDGVARELRALGHHVTVLARRIARAMPGSVAPHLLAQRTVNDRDGRRSSPRTGAAPSTGRRSCRAAPTRS